MNFQERVDRVDRYLSSMSASESRGRFCLNRDRTQYLQELQGISASLAYVRANTKSKIVVDIGAGKAIGINQIAQSEEGEGLQFLATGLRRPDNMDTGIPYLITSGEYLKGLPRESVGGALALYSITYSPEPEMVSEAIDRVLVPGGILKTALLPYITRNQIDLAICKADEFSHLFTRKGYDTFIDDNVLLAIKPGGSPSITARLLMESDQLNYIDHQRNQ